MRTHLGSRLKGSGIETPGSISGSPGAGAAGVFISNVRLEDIDFGTTRKGWRCDNVSGTSTNVLPQPCPELGGR